MKSLLTVVAVALVILVGVNSNQAQDKDKKIACKCPVSGKEAKETSAVDYNGAKVYFCCDNCPKEFAANKAKYVAKANLQLVCTKQAVETLCPFTGMQLNEDATVVVGGAKVAFCCQMCQGKAENLPAEALINQVFNEKTFKKAFEVSKKK